MDISGEVQSQNDEGRFAWIDFEPPEKKQDDGAEVIAGLSATPKTLPPKYFYDDPGSLLFEQITEQPEYYPTRTEESILAANAADIVAQTGPCELVELGSGSASKTRVLIDAYFEDWREEVAPRETSDSESDAVRFIPVDVSGGILKSSSRELLTLYPDLNVWGLVGTYEQALDNLPPRDLKNRMVLFLGSTIGNLSDDEAAEFFGRTADSLNTGEYFLLGFDRQKDIAVIEAAYNDDAGVTADFNLNALTHLNGRFDGDFDVSKFRHKAFYNRDANQIEMHLESQLSQTVMLKSLDLAVNFEEGETIHTEISRKFDPDRMAARVTAAGFESVKLWTDEKDWFALSLFQKL